MKSKSLLLNIATIFSGWPFLPGSNNICTLLNLCSFKPLKFLKSLVFLGKRVPSLIFFRLSITSFFVFSFFHARSRAFRADLCEISRIYFPEQLSGRSSISPLFYFWSIISQTSSSFLSDFLVRLGFPNGNGNGNGNFDEAIGTEAWEKWVCLNPNKVISSLDFWSNIVDDEDKEICLNNLEDIDSDDSDDEEETFYEEKFPRRRLLTSCLKKIIRI